MRIVVTGADGFIGGYVERALREAGHDVTGTVFDAMPGPAQVRVDLTRAEDLERLPREVDVLVHVAGCVAHGGVPAERMFALNAEATRMVANWAVERGVAHFVHTSSIAVYGMLVNGENRREDTTRRMRGRLGIPYMRSKALAEHHVERSGVPYTMLRPPAVLGEGDSIVSGAMVSALRGKGLPLPVGGSGDRMVSIILAANYADLVCSLVASGPQQQAFNVADNHLRWEDFAAEYARALGTPLRFYRSTWLSVLARRNDPGFLFLWMAARFGSHFPTERLGAAFDWQPRYDWREAVRASVSSR